ncbi:MULTISPECIES: LysM peptidoglycan-binding domain-containing protein [Lachnospiraceae]|jgi:phage protein D|uniref:Phage protein D n=1 Tax=Enterocloster clostridioformis TaxID=1531 RepID=A0A2X2U9F0_9FIRM|nr:MULTISPECIES: LysM peptidoglycan-binding domain-containing protein [Lachnospiraceae]CUO38507.1 Phage protein D [[Clostridium] symbiosum]SQB14862.1 Phage protein D [Enterocloster clostridioformis]
MSEARRVELRLEFLNIDVPDDLARHLLTANYTDNEEDSADDFQLSYDDRERNLNGSWLEVKPTIIKSTKQVKKQVAKTEVINYVVKRGDTLWAIARKYLGSGTKYPQIAQENGIKNPNLIYPGQVFRITTGGAVTTTVTETKEEIKVGAEPRMVKVTLVQKNWNDTGKNAVLDCGTFEIDSVDLSGPPLKTTLKSTSIPYTSTLRMMKKSRNWEKISLKAITQQIANEAGLKMLYESSDNPEYDKKEQVQQSDIRFLQDLCHAEGKALKVTKLSIVIFDKQEYDGKPAVKTITYGSSDILSFRMATKLTDAAYTSCHVSYTNTDKKQTIEYTYTPDSTVGTGQVLEVNERVANTQEAMRLAKKRLREKNAQEFTASFKMVGDVQLVAGIVVQLRGFQEFDKKYRVKSAKHSLTGGYTTDIELVQILEGY